MRRDIDVTYYRKFDAPASTRIIGHTIGEYYKQNIVLGKAMEIDIHKSIKDSDAITGVGRNILGKDFYMKQVGRVYCTSLTYAKLHSVNSMARWDTWTWFKNFSESINWKETRAARFVQNLGRNAYYHFLKPRLEQCGFRVEEDKEFIDFCLSARDLQTLFNDRIRFYTVSDDNEIVSYIEAMDYIIPKTRFMMRIEYVILKKNRTTRNVIGWENLTNQWKSWMNKDGSYKEVDEMVDDEETESEEEEKTIESRKHRSLPRSLLQEDKPSVIDLTGSPSPTTNVAQPNDNAANDPNIVSSASNRKPKLNLVHKAYGKRYPERIRRRRAIRAAAAAAAAKKRPSKQKPKTYESDELSDDMILNIENKPLSRPTKKSAKPAKSAKSAKSMKSKPSIDFMSHTSHDVNVDFMSQSSDDDQTRVVQSMMSQSDDEGDLPKKTQYK